jgi:tetratricopeptide (TPR) repeat protein
MRSLSRIRFVVHPIHSNRNYHVTPDNVKIVLGQLPPETWSRLREVHFRDDFAQGLLGYANLRSGQLALTALPHRMSFGNYLDRQECQAAEFGAQLSAQWPQLAIRRFILYYVLLHELGHLQIIRPGSKRRHFSGERCAREFGHYWRRELWASPFQHPDPVHRPPTPPELVWPPRSEGSLEARLVDGLRNLAGQHSQAIRFLTECKELTEFQRAEFLAIAKFRAGDLIGAVPHFERAFELEPDNATLPHYFGVTLLKLRDYQRGWHWLELALRQDPSHEWARRQLSVSLFRRGARARAEQVLLAGLALDPGNVPLGEAYLDLLKASDRHAEARRWRGCVAAGKAPSDP